MVYSVFLEAAGDSTSHIYIASSCFFLLFSEVLNITLTYILFLAFTKQDGYSRCNIHMLVKTESTLYIGVWPSQALQYIEYLLEITILNTVNQKIYYCVWDE